MNGGEFEDAELIKAAEEHLKTGDYDGCRKTILTWPRYNPTNLTAVKILTLTDLLSSINNPTRPEHYSVMSLSPFTDDPTLIKSRFRALATLLNPNTNPLSLSSFAFSLLLRSRSVLSNPVMKREYDAFLRLFLNSGVGSVVADTNTHGFWTMCPYCYYVYEYEPVFKDLCLRCRNDSCRRGFTATEIRVPPPEAVARSGRYLCLGFSPVELKGLASWSPFPTPFEEEEVRVEKTGFKRRKSVGVCAKKVMGKGVRVQDDGGIFGCS